MSDQAVAAQGLKGGTKVGSLDGRRPPEAPLGMLDGRVDDEALDLAEYGDSANTISR